MFSAAISERRLSILLHGLSFLVLLVGFWLRLTELPHYPPGISPDESTKLIDGLRLLQSGSYPLYEDTGRPEPLWRLLYAFSTGLLGAEVWLNRLTYFFVGVVTLALAHWAARQSLHDAPPLVAHLAAVVALLTLAFALGHITLSRSYYRAMLQLPPMFITLGFLARGLRSYQRRDFIYAGIALGAVVYTYTAGYVVPLALAPLAVSLLLFRRRLWRKWLPALALTGLAALLVMSPMLVRLVQNPAAILARADDVSRMDSSIPLDGRLVERVLGQILVRGDENPQYNVAQAPMMPAHLAGLFWLGLAGLLIRLRQPTSALILAWLVLTPLPAILGGELPHGIRSVGLFAVLPLMAGTGVASVLVLLRPVVALRYSVLAGALLVLLGLGFAPGTAHTYKDYWRNPGNWQQWNVHNLTLTHNEWFFRTDRRALAEWMKAQEGPLLMPLAEFDSRITQAWLFSRYPGIHSAAPGEVTIPQGALVVLPYDLRTADFLISPQFVLLDGDTMTILPPFDTATPAAWAAEEGMLIPNESSSIPVVGRAFPLAATPQFMPRHSSAPYVLDGALQITGWYGQPTLTGEAGRYWMALDALPLRPLGHDYTVYVQVQTQDYERLGGIDRRSLRWLYPAFQWAVGHSVVDTYSFDLPALPMGAYRLVVGMYPNFGEQVAISLEGETIGTQATIAWLKVPPDEALTLPDERLSAPPVIAGSITLESVGVVQEGAVYEVLLTWQSQIERPDFDATIFVHVVDENGEIIAQEDARPLEGRYPTFIWSAGEVVRTSHRLMLPGISPDELWLRLGMYSFTPDPQNLPILWDGAPQPHNAVIPGALADFMRR